MKNKQLSLSLLFVSIFGIQHINAQFDEKMRFEVRACGSIPLGDFSNYYSYNQVIFGNIGSADTGIDIGIKLRQPTKYINNLSITLSVDFIRNEVCKQYKDDLYSTLKRQINNSSMSLNLRYPAYTNIPILIGLNYDIPIDDRYGFYIDGGIGANFASVSDLSAAVELNGLTASSTISINPIQALAGQVGAGILYNKIINLGINYNMLGTYSFTGIAKASNVAEISIPSRGNMSITTFSIYLGYRF